MEFVSQLFVLFLAYHTLSSIISFFTPPSLIRDLYVSTETYRQLGVGVSLTLVRGLSTDHFWRKKFEKYFVFLSMNSIVRYDLL